MVYNHTSHRPGLRGPRPVGLRPSQSVPPAGYRRTSASVRQPYFPNSRQSEASSEVSVRPEGWGEGPPPVSHAVGRHRDPAVSPMHPSSSHGPLNSAFHPHPSPRHPATATFRYRGPSLRGPPRFGPPGFCPPRLPRFRQKFDPLGSRFRGRPPAPHNAPGEQELNLRPKAFTSEPEPLVRGPPPTLNNEPLTFVNKNEDRSGQEETAHMESTAKKNLPQSTQQTLESQEEGNEDGTDEGSEENLTRCNACNMSFATHQSFRVHLDGMSHAIKKAAWDKEQQSSGTFQPPEKPDPESTAAQDKVEGQDGDNVADGNSEECWTFCKPCGTRFTEHDNYKLHIRGSEHRHKARELEKNVLAQAKLSSNSKVVTDPENEKPEDDMIKVNSPPEPMTSQEASSPWYCSCCDKQMNSELGFQRHKKETYHKLMKELENGNLPQTPQSNPSKARPSRRKKTAKAAKKVQASSQEEENSEGMEDELDPDSIPRDGLGNFICVVCNVPCNGLATYMAHIAGQKHLKKKRMMSLAQHGEEVDGLDDVGTTLDYVEKFGKIGDPQIMAQDKLEACLQPMIGLEYIIECQNLDQSLTYLCDICEATMNCRVLIEHVEGLKHRKNFMKIHFPSKHEQLFAQPMGRSALQRLAQEYAAEIQEKYGRQRIHVRIQIRPNLKKKYQNYPNLVNMQDEKLWLEFKFDSPAPRAPIDESQAIERSDLPLPIAPNSKPHSYTRYVSSRKRSPEMSGSCSSEKKFRRSERDPSPDQCPILSANHDRQSPPRCSPFLRGPARDGERALSKAYPEGKLGEGHRTPEQDNSKRRLDGFHIKMDPYSPHKEPYSRLRDPHATKRDPYAKGKGSDFYLTNSYEKDTVSRNRDLYVEDPYSSGDPYMQHPDSSRKRFAGDLYSPRDRYGGDPFSSRDPYARDPYSSTNHYVGDPNSSNDPYARDPYSSTNHYVGDPNSSKDPYARDPYLSKNYYVGDPNSSKDPYARDPYSSRGLYAGDPYSSKDLCARDRNSSKDLYAGDPYSSKDPYVRDPYSSNDLYAGDPYSTKDPYSHDSFCKNTSELLKNKSNAEYSDNPYVRPSMEYYEKLQKSRLGHCQ